MHTKFPYSMTATVLFGVIFAGLALYFFSPALSAGYTEQFTNSQKVWAEIQCKMIVKHPKTGELAETELWPRSIAMGGAMEVKELYPQLSVMVECNGERQEIFPNHNIQKA